MALIIETPLINALGKTEGCENSPSLILRQLKGFYSNEDFKELKYKIERVELDLNNLDASNKKIYEKAKDTLHKNKTIFLGGDHSISYSTVKAFFETFRDNSFLLVLDSHADCMHNFNPPTHEDWLRTLIEEGLVDSKNVLLFGLRNLHKIEVNFLKNKKINYFSCKEVFEQGIKESTEAVMEVIKNFKNLYVSIDIDILDSVFCPSSSYPEPAGLTPRDLIFLLQKISLIKNLKAADIVEVNSKDDVTIKIAAKIIAELI